MAAIEDEGSIVASATGACVSLGAVIALDKTGVVSDVPSESIVAVLLVVLCVAGFVAKVKKCSRRPTHR